MVILRDVAREAGVSIGAASSVLGGRSSTIGTSTTTKQRILEAAQRLGYSPSPVAVSLSTGRTFTLGLVIQDPLAFLSHPQGAITVAGICSGAAESGYRVLLVAPDQHNSLDPRLMDGCVVYGWVDDPTAEVIAGLSQRIPVASTYRSFPGSIRVTMIDQAEACFRRAAEYLFGLGHRHLAVVDLDRGPRQVRPCFEQIAREFGLEIRLEEFADNWINRAYTSVHAIAALRPMPSAVFAFDDDYARALIARLAHDGRRVPHDVSVFSGSTLAQGFQITPPLTGIDSHHRQQTTQFIRAFTQALGQKQHLDQIVIDPPPLELIERVSCRPRP